MSNRMSCIFGLMAGFCPMMLINLITANDLPNDTPKIYILIMGIVAILTIFGSVMGLLGSLIILTTKE